MTSNSKKSLVPFILFLIALSAPALATHTVPTGRCAQGGGLRGGCAVPETTPLYTQSEVDALVAQVRSEATAQGNQLNQKIADVRTSVTTTETSITTAVINAVNRLDQRVLNEEVMRSLRQEIRQEIQHQYEQRASRQ